jgi:CheY-like chemotaxis protein
MMIHAQKQLGSILVVEDDPDVNRCLTELLTAAGYRAVALESALGAAAIVRREQPAVILLDLGLPFRSGSALLAELTGDPATAAIPIIILSANLEVLTAARRSHAAAVLAKPFETAELLRTIEQACDKTRAATPAGEPAATLSP